MTPPPSTGRREKEGDAVPPVQRLKEELEPTWLAVWDYWEQMGVLLQSEMQDENMRLERSGVEESIKVAEAYRSHIAQFEKVMFNCMDRLDGFFRLVQKATTRESVPPETSTRDSADDVLDAYLGDTVVPRATTTNRSTQTDDLIEMPSPSKAQKRKHDEMTNMEIFDAMAKRDPVEDAKAKQAIKDEELAPRPTKQSRSIATTQPSHESSDKASRPHYRVPVELIAGRKALDVLSHRDRCSQREYEVQFHGLSKPVWVPMRYAPPDMKKLVLDYNKKRKEEKERYQQTRTDTTASGVYIVDKIVDHRYSNGRKEYLVKWDGYDTDENTWEPASKLRNEVPSIVRDYERKLAKKAHSKRIRPQQVNAPRQEEVKEQEGDEGENEDEDQEDGYYGHLTATSAGEASADDDGDDDEDDSLSKDDDLTWIGKGKAMALRGYELSPQVE